MAHKYLLTAIIISGTLWVCSTHHVLAQSFTNTSESAGINHVQVSYNLFGGGVAIFDYNNDGFEDIFLTGGVRADKLYKNNGDGTFEDVSLLAGIVLTETVITSGVVAGDINNDGFTDLFVTTESSRPNLLFINQGNGYFVEQSSEAGISGTLWSTGAAFGDYNQDGFLDIYVINYVENARDIRDENDEVIGFDYDCYANQLYINNGDNTFTESAAALGIDNDGCGLAVTFTDYNFDGIPDIYIANDFGAWVTPNALYENQYPENAFQDNSEVSGLNAAIYGMGIATGDINNDGAFDYYIANLGKNVLYKNKGNHTFENITDLAGAGNEFAGELYATSWGVNFFDYDLDGYEDLFVANGHTPSADFIKTAMEDPNKLYRNLGDETFADVSETEGVDDNGISRGSATFDYDNDGDLDLIVTKLSQSSSTTLNTLLYNNTQSTANHWLKVKLEGTTTNRSGFGAKAIIYQQGNLKIRELAGGSSHASKNSSILHFGLGSNALIDSIKIIWPGTGAQVLNDIEANQSYYILEGGSQAAIMGCMSEKNIYYNSKATYNSGCSEEEIITGIIDKNNLLTDFRIFPNPISGQARVYFTKVSGEENISLVIYDTQGKIVDQYDNIQHNTIIKKGSLPNGCYLYKAYSAKRMLSTGRLYIQH